MGFEQYHEPADELPPGTRTFARLKPALAPRRLVDFSGPHGWEFVNLYLQESFSFHIATPEAAVALAASEAGSATARRRRAAR